MEQAAFRALADPTRRKILHLLMRRDMTIAEVAQSFDMTRAAVKKHLTVLKDGGFITVQAKGRERINKIEPAGFAPVRDWLSFFDQFWDDKLGNLQRVLNKGDGI